MNEIQTLEGMVLLDPAVHMRTTFLARMSEDRGVLVHDLKLVLVCSDLEVRDRNDPYNGEQGTLRFVTLTATASVIVEDISSNVDLDAVAAAVAAKLAAGEVFAAFGDAVVDQWVERERHGDRVMWLTFARRVSGWIRNSGPDSAKAHLLSESLVTDHSSIRRFVLPLGNVDINEGGAVLKAQGFTVHFLPSYYCRTSTPAGDPHPLLLYYDVYVASADARVTKYPAAVPVFPE
ncbi:hypothetical protein ABEF94_014498 [Exophiala dermatitidis]